MRSSPPAAAARPGGYDAAARVALAAEWFHDAATSPAGWSYDLFTLSRAWPTIAADETWQLTDHQHYWRLADGHLMYRDKA